MGTWQLLARDKDRNIVGVLQGWEFTLTLRFNEVGSWEMTIPREMTPSGWPHPGAGVIFLRDGKVVASGNIDEEQFTWSPLEDAPGTYKLTGDTDLGRLAYRVVYPDPTKEWEEQSTQSETHYVTNGVASTVIKRLADRNCNIAGTNGLASRKVPGLVLGSNPPVGSEISIKERFTPLLDAMRSAAFRGGGMRFDALDRLNGTIAFDVWPVADRSDVALFGVQIGNVVSLDVRRISPVGTAALVAGSDEGVARQLLERRNQQAIDAWGRRELFLDQRQTDDTSEYEEAADEALEDNGEQVAVSAVVVDTLAVQWGRDYSVGDTVGVITPFGTVVDVVREVRIEVDPNGLENVTSTIGTSDTIVNDPLTQVVDQLSKRISQLERSQ
jgi:hypothetical protein